MTRGTYNLGIQILSSHGTGALAGVRGTSAIGIRIKGIHLPAPPRDDPDDGADDEHDIELNGLAFEGTVVIGRRSPPKLEAWYTAMISKWAS